ncbi:MAG: DUF2802 domain-containing protein [Desulfobacterota bacterium]|jgi:hypothetical protein|nr:DUF2802 domain-containing protein [Thermodesulfobacteriota bacterium]
MTAMDLGFLISEGAAIILLAGSLWFMLRTKIAENQPWSETPDGPAAPASQAQLRQLVEESQALCQELLNGLDDGKGAARGSIGRGTEQVARISRLLNRVGAEPELAPEVENRNRYHEAIDLAREGFSLSEIGKKLDLTKGEVQLLLDLKSFCLQ